MARLAKLNDSDVERVLAGDSAVEDPGLDLLASALEDLTSARAARPAAAVEASHLEAVVALARDTAAGVQRPAAPSTTSKRTRRVMNRKRFAIQLAGGTLAAVLGTASLAVAGVTLPGPAQDAFEAAGIQLPNQAGGAEEPQGESGKSDAVHAVIDATAPQDRGCDFGQQVAAAVRNGAAQGPQGDPCSGGDENATASDASGEHSAPTAGREFGQSTSSSAQESASQDGQAFGDGTSQGAQSLGDQLSQGQQGNPDTGEQESSVGTSHADAGAGNAPSVP